MRLKVKTKSFNVYGGSKYAIAPGTCCNCWCCCCCHFKIFFEAAGVSS